MSLKVVSLLCAFVGFCVWPAGAASGLRLDLQYPLLDHSVYEFLDRAETRDAIPMLSDTRPYMSLKQHPVPLREDAADSREVRRYMREGAARMGLLGWEASHDTVADWNSVPRRVGLSPDAVPWLYADGFHLATFEIDTTFRVALQPVYGLEVIETDDERGKIARFTSGIRLEGGYAR